MSSTAQYPAQNNVSYPALHLYPLDDSFIPKRIALTGPRVKIARPPNTKTQPAERNGYFDSRVLSRQHAEVWEEGNKIFIKDVKSSNGTFINGERLSLEGRESEPFELKSDDILEFGVDIVSEDNKTVLHRKVVARVACYFPKQGAAAPPSQDQFATMSSHSGATYLNGGVQRRPQVPMIHQGLAGLGGMGGGIRAPGRGLTLDHIFSRLQAELAKSRDTGNDLQVLTGTLNNIEDTLNGALPPTSLPQFPDVLPGVRPPQPVSVPSLPSQAPAAETAPTDAIAALQVQLLDHQAALAAHVDGIRALEGVLAEQEAMKREVRELREFVGVDRREEEEEEESKADDGEDDDSDAKSVMTVTPHVLERVEEEEEEEDCMPVNEGNFEDGDITKQIQNSEPDGPFLDEPEEDSTRHPARPPTPGPTDLGISDDRYPSSPRRPPPSDDDESPPALSLSELTSRLALLASQLDAALAASSALQAQHATAQVTIATLEAKLARLEARADAPVPPAPAIVSEDLAQSLQTELAEVRGELAAERGLREALAGVVAERIDAGCRADGDASRSRSRSGVRRRRGRRRGSSADASASAGGSSARRDASLVGDAVTVEPPTAELALLASVDSALSVDPIDTEKPCREDAARMTQLHVQTALGVLLLGIAAAAVLWRVKPE